MLKISTRLMIEGARKRGWKAEPLDEKYSSVYKITFPNGKFHYLFSNQINSSTASGYAISEDKLACFKIAETISLPVNPYQVYDEEDREKSKRFFQEQHKAGKELVVKPIDRGHGDGITVGVRDEKGLQKAIAYAKTFSDKVLLQQRFFGKDHRLFVVDGKVIAVAHRVPPYVVGDGKQTIRELIVQKNQDPRRGDGHQGVLTKISIADVSEHLGEERLGIVPSIDERIELLGTANLSRGGESIDVTDDIDLSYKQAAIRLAALVELTVCGVDLLCTDITQPMSSENTTLLEINASPGVRMHHFPSEGKPRDVTSAILDAFAKFNKI